MVYSDSLYTPSLTPRPAFELSLISFPRWKSLKELFAVTLNSDYLLGVYPGSFPHLSWPLVQYILFLLFVLPAASSTVYYIFLFEILVCFFFFPLTSSKKLSPPPAVLLAFWFGRWSFCFQLLWWRFAGPCACFNTLFLSTPCFWTTEFANKSGTVVFKLVTHSIYSVCSGSSTICPSWNVGLFDILRLRNCHLKLNESETALNVVSTHFLFLMSLDACWHPQWLLTSK